MKKLVLEELSYNTRRLFLGKFLIDDPSECWPWLANRDKKGYGRVEVPGWGNIGAHRVSFVAFIGPEQDGYEVDHKCFNPSCVNPTHLRLLTIPQNRGRKARVLRNECFRGHPFTPENTIVQRSGIRTCRTCVNAAKRALGKRNRESARAQTLARSVQQAYQLAGSS